MAALAAAAAEKGYGQMKLATLKRMLFVRGVECAHCTSKADWVAQMEQHGELPEQPELTEQWAAQKKYAKKAKELNLSREEFLSQMNETEAMPLDGARADRLWAAFQEQLREGEVEFLENGSVRFAMPVTHRISPYLHPVVVDAIEWVASRARRLYTRLPRGWRAKFDVWLDWAVETGALYAAVVVLLAIIALDVLMERRERRGAQPDERSKGKQE